jgi:cell division protein FtsW
MGKCTFILLICASFLFSMGLLMIFNTTAAEAIDRQGDVETHHILFKQISYAFVGILLAFGVWTLGYHQIARLSPIFLFFVTISLCLVFLPPLGQEINGAHRWIGLFGLTIQPSEFAKYLIPIYFIHRQLSDGSPASFKDFCKRMLIFLVPIGLILVEPDNGTTGIILFSLLILFYLSRIKMIYWALPFLFFVLLGGVVASRMPHVPDRIRIYLHPELDILGKGHQPYQAKIAAGSGQLFGKGLGESLQKLNYLPEARSDYLVAIYAEEFGFVGVSLLIIIYMLMTWAGFSIASRAADPLGFSMGMIMTVLISFQAFLNFGIVSGLLPSKGTTLPFFSQGGTALIANIIALTLLLHIEYVSRRKESFAS